MHYAEILPSIHLREYIKCFWTLEQIEANQIHQPEPVLPDGRIELIFNLATPFKRYHFDGTTEIQPRSIIVGQTLKHTTIKPLGHINLFGVRFQTAGAHIFFDFPLNELTDKIENLDNVLAIKGKYLEQRINEANSVNDRIALIENEVSKKMTFGTYFDISTAEVVKIIEAAHGLISIENLSKKVGISSRQLERKFQQYIGLSPKSFCRIKRIQSILDVMNTGEIDSWADLTLGFGYFDQAHFVRDFKLFTGKSPTVYLAVTKQMTDIFVG